MLENKAYIANYLDGNLKQDKDIILTVLNSIYYHIITDIPSIYIDDEDIIESLCNISPHSLSIASDRLKNNKKYIKTCKTYILLLYCRNIKRRY